MVQITNAFSFGLLLNYKFMLCFKNRVTILLFYLPDGVVTRLSPSTTWRIIIFVNACSSTPRSTFIVGPFFLDPSCLRSAHNFFIFCRSQTVFVIFCFRDLVFSAYKTFLVQVPISVLRLLARRSNLIAVTKL